MATYVEGTPGQFQWLTNADNTFADHSTRLATHTTQIAAGDVTNPASAAGVAMDGRFARKDSIPVNVKDFGAVGDGVVDDTSAVRAAINESTAAKPRAIYFPNGTYRITAELTINVTGTALIGESITGSVIKQATDGVPILAFRADSHSILLSGLTLKYSVQQTVPGATAVFYDSIGTGQFYHNVYENLLIANTFRGFVVAQNHGVQVIWNSSWTNVRFVGVMGWCFNPSALSGAPRLTFTGIGVYNYGGVVNVEPPFYLSGCEVQATGISIEVCSNDAFYVSGGSSVKVSNLHVEGHKFSLASATLISVYPSCFFRLENFSLQGATTATNVSATNLFSVDPSTYGFELINGWHNIDTTLGGGFLYELVWAGGDTVNAKIRNVVKAGGGINELGMGTRAVSQAKHFAAPEVLPLRVVTASYAITKFDYLIAGSGTGIVVTLPPTSAYPVGKMFRVKNTGASAITVQPSIGETVDGAASRTLAQWAVEAYVSAGGTWILA